MISNHPDFNVINDCINYDGYFEMILKPNQSIKIYTINLALFLNNEKPPYKCFVAYSDAYKEGTQFFKENFLPSVNTLYGENAKLYVKDLHNHYLHTEHHTGYKGWNFIKSNEPMAMTEKIIKDFGYYAGIVSEADKMIDNYFELFDELDKGCNTDGIKSNKPDEVYKSQYLFKVGLLFAKGVMNKYFTVNSNNATVMNSQYTAPKIAKELRNDSYNKYILASINNYTDKENGNKNIFNSLDMMTKIISHCETENIPVDTYFKSRLPME